MKENENYKIGIIGTIIFHALLCVLLYFSAFKSPLPLPPEEGILVNFGDVNNGMQNQKQQRGHISKAEIVQANIKVEKENVSSDYTKNTAKEKILTQDTEDAPSVVNAKEIAKKAKIKDQATKKWIEKIEKNNKKLEEDKRLKLLNKQKEVALKQKLQRELDAKLKIKKQIEQEKIETERIRKVEIEKKKEEKRKIEEKKKKLEAIKNRAKNAFAKKTSTNNSTSKTVDSNNNNTRGFPSKTSGSIYGQGDTNSSIGSGLGTKGISFSLKGRKSSSVPVPKYNLQESGRVIVEITVNKLGIVTNARPGMPGSTTTSPQLYDAAKKAALKARFNADDNAPEYQKGRISYTFFLN